MRVNTSVQDLNSERRRLKALEGARRILSALEAANDSLQVVDDPFGSAFLRSRLQDIGLQLTQTRSMVDGLASMLRTSVVLILILLPALAGADCFYSCLPDPDDSVAYYMSRDGDYHPFPSPPPPPIVYGPPVYYDHGYPVPVATEPPSYHHHQDNYRREAFRREVNEFHDQNHRDFLNRPR